MTIERLNVLYDADCGFCGRTRTWLNGQPQLIELKFIPRDAPEVPARFPGLDRAATSWWRSMPKAASTAGPTPSSCASSRWRTTGPGRSG